MSGSESDIDEWRKLIGNDGVNGLTGRIKAINVRKKTDIGRKLKVVVSFVVVEEALKHDAAEGSLRRRRGFSMVYL